jgi:hypothetical protein
VKRTLVPALTYLVVLLVGGTLGFVIGNKYGSARIASFDKLGLAVPSGMPAFDQRIAAADARYENALRAYASLLDELSLHAAPDFARQRYAADKALALIRVADLAEKRGASAESTRLTADALAVCATAGLPYCSSEELRQRAQNVDAFLESNQRNKRDK